MTTTATATAPAGDVAPTPLADAERLSPAMRLALVQLDRTGQPDGIRPATLDALVRRGLAGRIVAAGQWVTGTTGHNIARELREAAGDPVVYADEVTSDQATADAEDDRGVIRGLHTDAPRHPLVDAPTTVGDVQAALEPIGAAWGDVAAEAEPVDDGGDLSGEYTPDDVDAAREAAAAGDEDARAALVAAGLDVCTRCWCFGADTTARDSSGVGHHVHVECGLYAGWDVAEDGEPAIRHADVMAVRLAMGADPAEVPLPVLVAILRDLRARWAAVQAPTARRVGGETSGRLAVVGGIATAQQAHLPDGMARELGDVTRVLPSVAGATTAA